MHNVLRAAFWAALFVTFLSRTLLADPVTLSLSDGSFSVTGELVQFDGQYYEIDTDLGILTLSQETTKCVGGACPSAADVVPMVHISGAASLGDVLLSTLIEKFAHVRGFEVDAAVKNNGIIAVEFRKQGTVKPVAIFNLTLSSTAQGIADMLFGKSQLVMARRALTPGEKLAIESRFAGAGGDAVRSVVMGWENLRLYTSPNNLVEKLTVGELIKMVETSPSFWPEWQGQRHPVLLAGGFDSVSALRQQLGFKSATPILTGNRNLGATGVLRIAPNSSADLMHVELTAGCQKADYDTLIPPDDHPLKSPLFLFASPTNLPPIARDFWSFLLTPQAQASVAQLGFISRTPTETRLNSSEGPLIHSILNMDDDMRASDLQKAVQTLFGYGRLSLTFRFKDGTRILDEESKSNLGFLARLLAEKTYVDREIIFAGFSDSKGSAQGNIQISLDRAQAMRGTIRTLMGNDAPPKSQFRAIGFGEALPLACNDTMWGQNQNRRVEIWIK